MPMPGCFWGWRLKAFILRGISSYAEPVFGAVEAPRTDNES
jgi:hypothetical protein